MILGPLCTNLVVKVTQTDQEAEGAVAMAALLVLLAAMIATEVVTAAETVKIDLHSMPRAPNAKAIAACLSVQTEANPCSASRALKRLTEAARHAETSAKSDPTETDLLPWSVLSSAVKPQLQQA